MSEMTFEHLGVAVTDIDQAIKSYQDLFGYKLISGPFDDPVQQATVCFLGPPPGSAPGSAPGSGVGGETSGSDNSGDGEALKITSGGETSGGDVVIELIAPLGEDSHVKRLIEKGGGAYHICYQVDDIEQTLAELRSKGCIVIQNPTPAVAYGGKPIAWFFTPSRQLTELVQK